MATRLIDRIAVEVDGDGEPLVMLLWTGRDFEHLYPADGRTHRPLQGGAHRPPWDRAARPSPLALSIQVYVDCVLRVFEALGIEHAHLAGHSLGTTVCFHLAGHSSRNGVLSLALIAPRALPARHRPSRPFAPGPRKHAAKACSQSPT